VGSGVWRREAGKKQIVHEFSQPVPTRRGINTACPDESGNKKEVATKGIRDIKKQAATD